MTAKTLLAALGLGALLLGVTATDAAAHGRGRHDHRTAARAVRPAPVFVRPAPVVVAPHRAVVVAPAPRYVPAPVVVRRTVPVIVSAPAHRAGCRS